MHKIYALTHSVLIQTLTHTHVYTNSFFSVCECVSWGFFLCIGLCGFKFTGNSVLFLIVFVCVYVYTCLCMFVCVFFKYVCVCVCVSSVMFSSENMPGIRST